MINLYLRSYEQLLSLFCNNCTNYNVTGVDFEDTTPDIMGYINQVVAETNQGTNNL